MPFNPQEHMVNLSRNGAPRLYLETKWRLVWFRDEHPRGQLVTELLNVEPAIFKATVLDENGAVLAVGHGMAVDSGDAVWKGRAIEKAETAAIGRALAHAGYGTQFTDEDEGEFLADAPVERKDNRAALGNGSKRRIEGDGKSAANGNAFADQGYVKAFVAHWTQRGLKEPQIREALGIERYSEWTQGEAAAIDAVEAFVERQAAS